MSTDLVNIRESFISRDGFFLWDCDFIQIEPRLSAAHSGERPLLDGFIANHDFYSTVYSQMSKIPLDQVTKKLRQIGKVIVLRSAYGGGANGLARTLGIEYDEAVSMLEAYQAGLPALTAATNELLIRARREGGVRTIFGSFMPLPDLSHQDQAIRAKAERQTWNRLIQGSAALWLKIGMLRLDRALADRDAHILLTVHDELVIECSVRERAAEIAWLIRDALEFKVADLPIDAPAFYPSNRELYPDGFFVPIDLTAGMSWGDQRAIEDTTKKDKSTGEPRLVKGFRTQARELGLGIDFDTFEQPRPDYLKPRRNRFGKGAPRYSKRKRAEAVATPQQVRAAAMFEETDRALSEAAVDLAAPREVSSAYGPDGLSPPPLSVAVARSPLRVLRDDEEPSPPIRIINAPEEAIVDPFRYPCVVVKLPPIDSSEERVLTLAADRAAGGEHLFIQYGESLVDTRRQVDAKGFVAILSKLQRISSVITSERYNASGALVRKEF